MIDPNSFPLLTNSDFAYLDNAATTQKPERVIKAVEKFYRKTNSNVHRGVYALSQDATQAFEGARKTIAKFLNASTSEIIFTSGATGSLNLLAQGLSHNFSSTDTIVLTELEHHSNLLPWLRLAETTGCKVEWIPVLESGVLDLEAYYRILETHTVRLVAFANVSHVLGNRQPTGEIIDAAKNAGAWTVVDATQSVAREKLDVKSIGCDALVFSGHKVYAPTGIGILFASAEIEKLMKPFHLGGGMVDKLTKSQPASWRQAPWKFEAGTPPIEGAVALAEAVRFVEEAGAFRHASRESKLAEGFANYLSKVEGIHLYGWAKDFSSDRPRLDHEGILSFSLDGLHPHDIAQTLADEGVAVRAGHHCAQVLTDKIAPEGCVRLSLAIYNSDQDLKNFEQAFASCLKLRSEMNAEPETSL